MGKIDTQQLIQGINLIKLAACYTELHNESTKEFSGPCPKCGGHDRFHVTANWFFCRQCHEKRGDAIEYMRWLRSQLIQLHQASKNYRHSRKKE